MRDYACVPKRIGHPAAGLLSFDIDIEVVSAPQDPGQRLVVYTAQADSPTARLLPILASWAGEAPSPRAGERRPR